MFGQHERGHPRNDWRRHRRARLLLVSIPEPGAQNVHTRRPNRNTLHAEIRKRRELIVTIESGNADHVRHVESRRIVRRAIVVSTRISSRGNEQNVTLVRLANRRFECARALRRTPARTNHAYVHAGLLAFDGVVDRFNRILGRSGTACVHKLQRHDLNFPIHSGDAEIILAFSADDASTVCAVSVVVHRVGSIVDRVEAIYVVDRAELVIMVRRQSIGTRPHVSHEVFMRVIDAGVEDCDDNIFAARSFGPCKWRTDVCAFLAASLSRVGKRPLIFKLRIVRQDRHQRSFVLIEFDLVVGFSVLDFRKSSTLNPTTRSNSMRTKDRWCRSCRTIRSLKINGRFPTRDKEAARKAQTSVRHLHGPKLRAAKILSSQSSTPASITRTKTSWETCGRVPILCRLTMITSSARSTT